MKAIILAAGEGKRLRPLTKNKPKCMIQLFGKSLLEWQIKTFQECGIHDIIVVTGYHNETINFSNIKCIKNQKFNQTNMIESLFCAKDYLNQDVIISYGDIVFERKIIKNLMDSNNNFSIVVDLDWKDYWNIRFKNPILDAESLKMDQTGTIQNIGQKVTSLSEIEGQYIGLMRFKAEGIEFLKKFYESMKTKALNGENPLNKSIPFEKSYMTDLLYALIKNGQKLKAVTTHNGWLELDTIEDFQLYTKMYKEGTITKFIKLKCF